MNRAQIGISDCAGELLLLAVVLDKSATDHVGGWHEEFASPPNRLPLRFPEELTSPSYIDFMYFAFTISVAVQTSDVSVRTRSMRATVLVHSVLSFFFNLAVLGLSINIAATVAGAK